MPLPAQWSVGGPCASRCANASSLRTPYFVTASGISGACFTAIRERQFPDLGVVQAPAFQNSISGFDPLQSLFDSCLPFPPLIEFLARDLILHETPMRLEAGAGVD